VLAPDEPYPHYCRSIVLEQRRQFAEAERSAREALRLNPADADNYARVAVTLFAQEKWQATLGAALAGLAYDAEHAGCQNLRTMALTKLGRQHEAVESVDESLARDPDNALSHANKGWTLLHQGQPKEALEHFREALRLDPTFDYARAGMIEALKARNPVYRWMLAYFLWMARLSDRARWGVILGGWFGAKLLGNAAQSNPAIAPWVLPLQIAYLLFVMLTWFAVPLFNLLLRFNRYGRHALSRDQRLSSNWFAACLALFAGGAAATFFTESNLPFALAIFGLGMALPLTTVYHCDPGWPRRAMGWYATGLAVIGLAVLTALVLEITDAVASTPSWIATLIPAFGIGAILAPWVANYLVTQTAPR
jgi:hypothetical protein